MNTKKSLAAVSLAAAMSVGISAPALADVQTIDNFPDAPAVTEQGTSWGAPLAGPEVPGVFTPHLGDEDHYFCTTPLDPQPTTTGGSTTGGTVMSLYLFPSIPIGIDSWSLDGLSALTNACTDLWDIELNTIAMNQDKTQAESLGPLGFWPTWTPDYSFRLDGTTFRWTGFANDELWNGDRLFLQALRTDGTKVTIGLAVTPQLGELAPPVEEPTTTPEEPQAPPVVEAPIGEPIIDAPDDEPAPAPVQPAAPAEPAEPILADAPKVDMLPKTGLAHTTPIAIVAALLLLAGGATSLLRYFTERRLTQEGLSPVASN